MNNIVHNAPILNICFRVTFLFVSTIALGGVLIGNRNAIEMHRARGVSIVSGDLPCCGAIHAMALRKMLAAAMFDTTFVMKHPNTQDITIEGNKSAGPLLASHRERN